MSTLALAYAIEAKGITTHTNHNFTGATRFKGKTLFIGTGGLFESGGTTDNGTAIQPSLKTGKMNQVQGRNGLIPVNALKKLYQSKIRVACNKDNGSLDLVLTADEDTYTYTTDRDHTGFATHNITVGKGLKFNYLQLEFKANGCTTLDIDSIEFEPKAIARNER